MTALTIEVALLPDSQEIVFSAIALSHKGCKHPSITNRRVVLTGFYTLNCPCGLEILLPQDSGAETKILKVAIDGEPTQLDPGTFSSNLENAPVHLVTAFEPESTSSRSS